MTESLEKTLVESIDYAGLFPPARLAMESSYSEFLKHRTSPAAWMLRSFVCPANRLLELAAQIERKPPDECVSVSVIGTGGDSQAAWEYGLEHDARHMESFVAEVGEGAELVAFEVKLPHNERLRQCLEDLKPFDSLDVFLEVPWNDEMEDSIVAIASTNWVCAKARTGGTTAEAFPSAAQLAAFVQSCVQVDLAFKFTAGLHNPLAGLDKAIGVSTHGFLNAFVATALAAKLDLNKKEIEEILLERDPSAFAFTNTDIRYGEISAGLLDLDDARGLFLSFGSCSVEDPWKGLISAGYVQGTRT